MALGVGDKVRSAGGVEGEVVTLNADQHSVMVKVPGDWRGTGIVSIPLARLVQIEVYTSTRGFMCYSNPNHSTGAAPDR